MFSSIDLRGEQGKDIGCLITKITKSISAKCTVNASILFIAFTLLPLTFFRRTQNICWKLPDPRSINWILVWIFLPFWTQRKRIREGERGGERGGEFRFVCSVYTTAHHFYLIWSVLAKARKYSLIRIQLNDVDALFEYHHFIQLHSRFRREKKQQKIIL